jgi:flagellar biosynthetic protein FliR
MTLQQIISVNQIVMFILVLTRLTGVFLISPLLSNRSVPERVKIPLIVMISIILMPVVAKSKPITLTNHIQLLIFIFEELTIGLIIGFVASLTFSAIQIAGEIFGSNIGYSIATILDPSTESDIGVLSTLYMVLGALFFLYLNGHHMILAAVGKSFQVLPLGGGFSVSVAYSLSVLVEKVFVMSIQIAAPVVVVITILNLMFGLITKISPQMNIYFNVGFIIGPIIGISVLILSLPLFRMLMGNMIEGLNDDLLRTLQQLKGAAI